MEKLLKSTLKKTIRINCNISEPFADLSFTLHKLLELIPESTLSGKDKIINGFNSLDDNVKLDTLYSLMLIANLPIYKADDNDLINDGVQNLNEYKSKVLNDLSADVLEYRKHLIPDYKLINASLNIYDDVTKQQMINTISTFRTEFYRIKTLIDSANNITEINQILNNVNLTTITIQ